MDFNSHLHEDGPQTHQSRGLARLAHIICTYNLLLDTSTWEFRIIPKLKIYNMEHWFSPLNQFPLYPSFLLGKWLHHLTVTQTKPNFPFLFPSQPPESSISCNSKLYL